MWRLLAAILWLGNVDFHGEEDAAAVAPGEALANASALLGVAEAALATALSQRVLSAGAPPTSRLAPGLRLVKMWRRAAPLRSHAHPLH